MKTIEMIGINLLKISTVYLLTGVCVGMYVGITKNYAISSVHAHINLLGWATMGLSGIAYIILAPNISRRLALIHFWSHNIGLPIMMISIFLFAGGNVKAAPYIPIGSVITLLSLLVFAVNIILFASKSNLPSRRVQNDSGIEIYYTHQH